MDVQSSPEQRLNACPGTLCAVAVFDAWVLYVPPFELYRFACSISCRLLYTCSYLHATPRSDATTIRLGDHLEADSQLSANMETEDILAACLCMFATT